MKTSLIIIAFILNISHNLCFAQKITYQIFTNIISYKGNNIKEIKSCELGENKIGESNWNVSLKKYDLNDTTGQQLDYNFELKDGCVSNIGFAIDFKIEQWDKRNMLFAPPGVRKRRYVMCGFVPSNDKGVAMKKGDITQFRLQLWDFPAKGIADFYES